MSTFVWAAAVAGNWATGANWQVAGTPQANPPTNADIAQFGTGAGFTQSNCTTAAGDVCGELNVDDAYTGTLTLANSTTALSVGGAALGALRFGTGMTLTNAGANTRLALVATSNNGGAGFNVTTNGKTLSQFRVAGAGGSWVLQDAITTNVNSSFAFVVAAGTLNTNGKTVTILQLGSVLTVSGGTLTTGASTFNFSATAAASFWSVTSGTVNGSGSTIVLTAATANTRTFTGNGQTYGTLTYTVAASSGQLTVTGANTFTAINVGTSRTLALPAGATINVTGPNGIGGIQGTINSSSSGTAATINLTSLFVSVMRAVTIKDITVTPNGHAYALDASVSTSGNTGITFNTPFGWGIAA